MEDEKGKGASWYGWGGGMRVECEAGASREYRSASIEAAVGACGRRAGGGRCWGPGVSSFGGTVEVMVEGEGSGSGR